MKALCIVGTINEYMNKLNSSYLPSNILIKQSRVLSLIKLKLELTYL